DPFAGSGTTLFVASQLGLDAVGIELLPIGYELIEVRKQILNGETEQIRTILQRWRTGRPWMNQHDGKSFPHLRITRGAFPMETESALGQYLATVEQVSSASIRRILRFAALCILEEIGYTRKDGQYLRWDHRSGRNQGSKPFDKGPIKPFDVAISQKLDEMCADIGNDGELFDLSLSTKRGTIDVIHGSCLTVLPQLETASFDGLITSPPYCNRYDYTRTYALELAMLGVDEEGIRNLRQAMVSCTVENREKPALRSMFSANAYSRASTVFDSQKDLQTILEYLEQRKASKALNNSGIPRMVRNYFFEMSLVIFECARILKPGAPLIMVNDNVRYEGMNIPVDLILSDIAQAAGFDVETIWVLPVGKGNSSQQMGEHGREELRKCVYIWR
ncbi:MAG: site-specific DNA-methyltransferase, partial [Candidatus Latescibacteria bacterium]|nr:site-specific DNA-methyltransferase [Candidatus Latescibacterota bacterium]